MRVKLLTFRYSATLGGFDDTPLADFTRDKEVIAQREHFYLVNETPHITLVITYQDAIVPRAAIEAARAIPPRPPSAPPPARFDRHHQRDGAPDPAAGLDENERALFNHLREWRSKQAHEEGLPAYLLLTNKQFVAIVRKRPESLNALGHIDGIGPGKIERYGAAILACVHGARPAQPASAVPAVDPVAAANPEPESSPAAEAVALAEASA
jgi:superfamily II DNA helicase RecQ